MKVSTKQTYSQTDWLEKEDYKNELNPCIVKKIAFCRKCRKTIIQHGRTSFEISDEREEASGRF